MTADPAAPAAPPGNSLAQAYVDRCLALGRAIPRDLIGALDVAYGEDPKQTLDVYRPPGATDLPVLVFFHGGGFTSGGKAWCRFMASTVCPLGVVLVCPSYRLVPDVEVADQVMDAGIATRWAADNAARFGGNSARLHVGGHSAGGALAALLGVGDKGQWLKGVFCLSGSMHRFAVTGTPGADYVLPPGPLPVDPGTPLAQAHAMRTRLLIGWGGAERQVERVERSTMAMIGVLRDHGVPVRWLYLPEANHFETHLALAEPGHPWLGALKHWMEDCL